MDNLTIGTLEVRAAGRYTAVQLDMGGALNTMLLSDAELDQLTDYLIELRGERRSQALLEQRT